MTWASKCLGITNVALSKTTHRIGDRRAALALTEPTKNPCSLTAKIDRYPPPGEQSRWPTGLLESGAATRRRPRDKVPPDAFRRAGRRASAPATARCSPPARCSSPSPRRRSPGSAQRRCRGVRNSGIPVVRHGGTGRRLGNRRTTRPRLPALDRCRDVSRSAVAGIRRRFRFQKVRCQS